MILRAPGGRVPKFEGKARVFQYAGGDLCIYLGPKFLLAMSNNEARELVEKIHIALDTASNNR